MTTILQAVILGIIQGITEWLPVSSSGHLVIFQHLFGIGEKIAMGLSLHLGTLAVVVFIFRNEIREIITSLLRKKRDANSRLALYIIIGSIPTALIGFMFRDIIEKSFENLMVVGAALIFTGVILYITKFVRRHDKKMDWKTSLFVGTMQGISIIPGVSRSGSTISAGLFCGVDRDKAARYSFLLFIPAIIGASILEIGKFRLGSAEVLPIILGTVTAMIVSYFTINLLLGIVRKGRLHWFSWYCWILGILVLAA